MLRQSLGISSKNIRNFASSVYFYTSPRKGAIFAYPPEYRTYIDLSMSSAAVDEEDCSYPGIYYVYGNLRKFIDRQHIKIEDALKFRYLPESRENYLEALRNSTYDRIQDVFQSMYIYLSEGLTSLGHKCKDLKLSRLY